MTSKKLIGVDITFLIHALILYSKELAQISINRPLC